METRVQGISTVIERLLTYHPGADLELVRRAHQHLVESDVGGQMVSHCEAVAYLLTELKLDETALAAALVQRTVEDTAEAHGAVASKFGQGVSEVVKGVVKLSKYRFVDREERQAESFRKMLMAMFRDVRVVLVKLADRVQETRTFRTADERRLLAFAKETLEIYAPLANRLGLYRFKTELEEAAFAWLYPEEHRALERQLSEGEGTRRRVLEEVRKTLQEEVTRLGIKAGVFAREKVRYSIFKKMKRQGVTLEQVYDVVAFRVIVDSVDQCWQVMGLVHQLWRPILGRFRDFIGNQKPNGYRSLHTSVIGPENERMEVQIRTWEMHDIAERGIAAHWKYKEGRSIAPADEARVHYFKSLIEELTEGDEATAELIEGGGSSPGGLAEEEIFVFTPTGAVRVLSRGATPVDFAFTVHSEVGLKCSGAKVNGVMAPLHTQLKNGDTVEILTSPNQRPSPDWLRFVKTTRTKSRIRAFLQQEAKERFAQTGRQLVEKELKKFGLSLGRVEKGGKITDWARSAGISEEALWVQIGAGKVSLDEVGPRLAGVSALDEAAQSRPLLKQAPAEGFRTAAGKGKVLVGGHADIEFRFARCCSPVVGEPIVGFVSKGHGISIHAALCPHARRMDPERFVAVEWAAGAHADQVVGLKISAYDSTGMLNAISSVFAEHGVNIRSVVMRSEDKRPVKRGATSRKRGDLLVKAEISNMSQLKTLLRALLRVDGVIKAERSS